MNLIDMKYPVAVYGSEHYFKQIQYIFRELKADCFLALQKVNDSWGGGVRP